MVTPFYQDQQITIYQGDALHVLPELDEAFDVMVADPPYSSGGQFRSDRMRSTVEKYVRTDTQSVRAEFAGDNRDQRAYFAWSALWLSFAMSRAKTGAHAFVFTDWRQLPVTTDAIQAGGWIWRGWGTWWKPGIRMQRGGLSGSAEYAVWGTAGSFDRELDYAPQNVISCAPVGDDKIHVAEKPDTVMAWLVKFCPAGGLVIDPFCGSGTTLAVAKRLGMRAIGIDIEPKYCQQAVDKVAQQALPLGER